MVGAGTENLSKRKLFPHTKTPVFMPIRILEPPPEPIQIDAVWQTNCPHLCADLSSFFGRFVAVACPASRGG
jgi:hypothetical protein